MLMGLVERRSPAGSQDPDAVGDGPGVNEVALADFVDDQVIDLAESYGWNVVAEAAARVVADRDERTAAGGSVSYPGRPLIWKENSNGF